MSNERFFLSYVPILGIALIVGGIALFVAYRYEFSIYDEDITDPFIVEDAELDLPENQLALNVNGVYSLTENQQRISDTDFEPLLDNLRNNVNIIEEAEAVEFENIAIILDQEADPTPIVDAIETTEPIQITELNSVVVTFDDPSVVDSFISEFSTIPVIDSMLVAADGRLIVGLRQNVNPPPFIQRFGEFAGVSDAEGFLLTQVNVALPVDSDVDSFVDTVKEDETVLVVDVQALSRLYITTNTELANVIRVTNFVTDELEEYYPRSQLDINLWFIDVSSDDETVLRIRASESGIPLYLFAWAFAVAEIIIVVFFGLRGTENSTFEKLAHPLIRAAAIFLIFWSIFGHEPVWDWFLGQLFPNNPQITSITTGSRLSNFVGQHLELVIVSSAIIIPLGLFIGIIVTRHEFREFLPLSNIIVNSAQTIPTLAVVALMVPIIGTGFQPTIIALVLYGLLPVVRNTIVGLESVSAFIVESARGMGMTPQQILLNIELPIASRVIIAGIRTSMVINVGTATLGAYVSSGGLGEPIAAGLSLVNNPFVLFGAIPAAILAVLIDYILSQVEYVVTPSGLQIEN